MSGFSVLVITDNFDKNMKTIIGNGSIHAMCTIVVRNGMSKDKIWNRKKLPRLTERKPADYLNTISTVPIISYSRHTKKRLMRAWYFDLSIAQKYKIQLALF